MDEDQRRALKSLLLKHRKCVHVNHGADLVSEKTISKWIETLP